MDPLDLARDTTVETEGAKTLIRVPTAMLWALVFAGLVTLTAGLAVLTWNVSLLTDRVEKMETALQEHRGAPSHDRGAQFLLEIDKRLREYEGSNHGVVR